MNFWFILLFVSLGLLVCCVAFCKIATNEVLQLTSGITAIVLCIYIVAMFAIEAAHVKTFERQYFNYVQLRLDIQEADMSDPIVNYDISDRVYEYNLWLEKNEDDFNNFWSTKCGLKYTNQFDYIEIKGETK